jgi:hypothetical protein
MCCQHFVEIILVDAVSGATDSVPTFGISLCQFVVGFPVIHLQGDCHGTCRAVIGCAFEVLAATAVAVGVVSHIGLLLLLTLIEYSMVTEKSTPVLEILLR